jgi:hypothetical protein
MKGFLDNVNKDNEEETMYKKITNYLYVDL